LNALPDFQPPYRSIKVTSHANSQPCTLRLRGICNGDPATTVFAHIRDRHKGMGRKASDHSGVFACYACHDYLDVGFVKGTIPTEELQACIIRGLQETWEILIRDGIIGFPHDKPKPVWKQETKPRKPKNLRAKVGGKRSWPEAPRPLRSRNNLRKDAT